MKPKSVEHEGDERAQKQHRAEERGGTSPFARSNQPERPGQAHRVDLQRGLAHARTAEMPRLRGRFEPHARPAASGSPEEIEILSRMEISLVEAAQPRHNPRGIAKRAPDTACTSWAEAGTDHVAFLRETSQRARLHAVGNGRADAGSGSPLASRRSPPTIFRSPSGKYDRSTAIDPRDTKTSGFTTSKTSPSATAASRFMPAAKPMFASPLNSRPAFLGDARRFVERVIIEREDLRR